MTSLIPVKNGKPYPIASFAFRGADVAVELTEDGHASVLCPVCETTCRVNLTTHAVVINLQTRKATTIYPGIICPSAQCGFAVVVVRGHAFEVEANRMPEQPEPPLLEGQVRCEECGRGFRPGYMKRKICKRCNKDGNQYGP